MRVLQTVLASLFVVLTLAVPAMGASIVEEAKRGFDRQLGDTVGSMAAGAREEGERFALFLKNEVISPTLKEIDQLLASNLENANQMAAERIEQLNQIVITAISAVERSLGKLDELRAKTIADVRQLQGEIVDNIFCATDALREKAVTNVEDLTTELVGMLTPGFFELFIPDEETQRARICTALQGLPETPRNWEFAVKFDVKECISMGTIDFRRTPARTIQSKYADLQNLAATMRCVFRQADAINAAKFSPNFFDAGRKVELWEWAMNLEPEKKEPSQ